MHDDVNERSRVGGRTPRTIGGRFVGDHDRGLASQSRLGGEGTRDASVTQADLEDALPEPDPAHRHGQRLASDRRLAQKHAHFLMI
jgi:hypothetical protein